MRRIIIFLLLLVPIVTSAQKLTPELHDKKGLYGYWGAKSSGRYTFLIAPKFEKAGEFSFGHAFVQKRGAWGIIDAEGKFVLKPKYDDVNLKSPHKRYFAVWQKSRSAVVDISSCKEVTAFKYDQINFVNEKSKFALVRVDRWWGILNLADGKEVAERVAYDKITVLDNGAYLLERDGYQGLANSRGEIFVKPNYAQVKCVNENLYALYKGGWIFVDGSGKEVEMDDRVLRYTTSDLSDISETLQSRRAFGEKSNFSGYICGNDGVLVFYEPPTAIADKAFLDIWSLTKIVLPTKIKTIGKYAFQNCNRLSRLTLPAGVTTIGVGAFYSCTLLSEIAIPEGVRTIEKELFGWCKYLKKVEVPNGVTVVEERAFEGCANLETLSLPGSVVSIGNQALSYCSGLRSVTIPDSVTEMGESLFENCSSLSSVTLSTSLKSIKDNTFKGCLALSSVAIPVGVEEIGQSAFETCIGLKTLSLPEGIVSIGNSAFAGCSELTSVTLPTTLRRIGTAAFMRCVALKSIAIPAGVTQISASTFEDCSDLTSVTIPMSVTSIGDRAFKGCSQFVGLESSNAITKVGAYAFSGCTSYQKIVISEHMTEIGDLAFAGCTGELCIRNRAVEKDYLAEGESLSPIVGWLNGSELSTLTFGDNIQRIGDHALSGCRGVASVTIPKSISSIGKSAFSGCTALVDMHLLGTTPPTLGDNFVDGCHETFKIHVPHSAFMTYLASGWSDESKRYIALEEGVQIPATHIVEYTTTNGEELVYRVDEDSLPGVYFEKYENGVGKIYFTKAVTSIVDRAFSDSQNLRSVTFPKSVTHIGSRALANVVSLTDVYMQSPSVPSLASDAFVGCGSVKIHVPNSSFAAYLAGSWSDADKRRVVTPNGYQIPAANVIEYITSDGEPIDVSLDGVHSNRYENGVGKICFFKAVTSIPEEAFSGCSSLKLVKLPNAVTEIGDSAFSECRGLTGITVPNSVTKIGDSAFSHCSNLTTVTLSNKLKHIGYRAFYSCSSLTSIVLPNSLTSLGEQAFEDCSHLKNVTIGGNLKTISTRAFTGCTRLQSVVIGARVSIIGECAFYNCDGLVSVKMPNSVTKVCNKAFAYCRNMKNLILSANLLSIGDYAFYNCSSLTQVNIPSRVSSIGYEAFEDCYNLKDVYCRAITPPNGSSYMFDDNASGRIIHVSYSVVGRYKSAEYWRRYAPSIEGSF